MSPCIINGISASIVLYKTPISQIEVVLRCLERSSQIKVLYVVDNSPTDQLRTHFDLHWTQYLHLEQNLGYGSAHNIAIKQVINHFDFHLVLNPDIYFEPDQLRKAIDRIRQDDRVGQLMPKVLNADGSIQYLCKLLPTPWDLIIRRLPPLFFKQYFKSKIDRYELRKSKYQYEMNVPNLSGCFMLLSCKALKEVGLFDERYFMYGEDVDMTRRIHRRYVTLYYPGSVITHLHNRESYRSLKMLWIHCVNLARYFSKWGWIYDSERKQINNLLLKDLNT
jgi:GT2 family glycosyltransferase